MYRHGRWRHCCRRHGGGTGAADVTGPAGVPSWTSSEVRGQLPTTHNHTATLLRLCIQWRTQHTGHALYLWLGAPIQSAECGGMIAFDANVNQHAANTSPRNLALLLIVKALSKQHRAIVLLCYNVLWTKIQLIHFIFWIFSLLRGKCHSNWYHLLIGNSFVYIFGSLRRGEPW